METSNSTDCASNMSSVHMLPCNVSHDGPVDVKSFFQVRTTKSDLRAAFRGRELVGKEVKLPTGVLGINARQTAPAQKTEAAFECEGHFDSMTVWQHDVAPDLGSIQDCLDWFEICSKVSAMLVHII